MVESLETPTLRPYSRVYEVERNKITVQIKEFSPSREVSPDRAIIFLPGWSAGNAKTLDLLSQRFAEEGERRSYSITTRPQQIPPDSLYQEAIALEQFIQEEDLKKLILAGHSKGGAEAVNLIDILQKQDPKVEIEGLILLDPIGLYEMGSGELAGKFAWDTAAKTPLTLVREALKNPSLIVKGLQASTDIIFNIAREIKASNIKYWSNLKSQIREMARANTHLADIKCPVVLIQGALDPVSSAERVVPKKEDREFWSTRRSFLKETLFPNVSDISMLIPKSLGHHGLPHFRPEQIAKTALYLLNRHKESGRWANGQFIPLQKREKG